MQRHLKPVVPVVSLSVEEEAILLDEQNQTVNGLVADEVTIDRVVDANEIILDAEHVMQQVAQAGPVEQELLGAVADMAIAGGDMAEEENPWQYHDPNSIHNSNESFVDSAMEKIKKLWEQIKAFLDRAWEAVKNFFKNIFSTTKPVKNKLDKLEAALDSKTMPAPEAKPTPVGTNEQVVAPSPTATKPHAKFEFFGDVGSLCLAPGKMCPPKQIVSELTRLNEVTHKVLNELIQSSEKMLTVIVDAIGDIAQDVMKTVEVVNRLAPKYNAEMEHLFNVLKIKPTAPSAKAEYAGPPVLLGGIRFVAYTMTGGHDSPNRFDMYKLLMENNHYALKEHDIEPLDPHDCEKIAKLTEQWLEMVESDDLKRKLDHVQTTAKRIDGLMGQVKQMKLTADEVNAQIVNGHGEKAFSKFDINSNIHQLIMCIQSTSSFVTLRLSQFIRQGTNVYDTVDSYALESTRFHRNLATATMA
jgi:hypothetical protein